jgi:hypothetical protein
MAEKNLDLKQALGQLEETLETYMVKKAPFSIPENWKELIVKFVPYLIILRIIFSVPTVFLGLGLGALVSPFSSFLGPSYGFNYLLSIIVLGVGIILEAMAVPGLFKRQEKSWRLLFYSSLVSALSGILGRDLIGTIIGVLLSWYILFQVKEYYK